MTKFLTTLSALALSISAANAAGYNIQTLSVDHRDRDLELHIWYPSQEDTAATMLGKNAVFKGSRVFPNATIQSGSHPLVVLSHGSGGNAANLSWIAAELADRGMIVMAPNHAGTTSQDSYPEQTIKIWERPMDLTAIINHASETMDIDETRVGSIGFSLGGYAALSLAGATVIKQDFVDYCARNAGTLDCRWYEQGGVDLNDIEQAPYEQSHRDPRITVAVAIDTALSRAFDEASLAAMDLPVQLINLGNADHVPAPYNLSETAEKFPQAQHHFIDQATHFSFLGECTAMGKILIMAAGEDPICSEAGNRSRADIQSELKASIGDFLHSHLIADTRSASVD